ncbi:MAG: DUF2163 domain-containing protein [Thermomicrobiales bacterium]|nr:DUF2163 domain-containing protein [Thermomicrobiales bacterium]
MKSISASLLAHIQSETTTLCTCWRVTRLDGEVFGFTDHTSNLAVGGVVYVASTGYTATAVRSGSALNVDNLDVEGALDSETITESDLLAGIWDFAAIEIFQVNYEDLTMGEMNIRTGNLGAVRTGKNAFVCELRGMMQRLQQGLGRLVMPGCNADLGDSRCGINLSTFTNGTVSGSVDSAASDRQFVDAGLTQATGWFAGGLLTWASGANIGLRMEVKQFTSGGTVLLQLPMRNTIAVGDTFTITAGCDKSLATCRDKFNNVVNFRGFPHLPGISRVASGS